MHRRTTPFSIAAAVLLAIPSAIHAQTFTPIPAFPFDTSGPAIRTHAEPLKPFTIAGERGVVLGQQDGTFEAWVLPVKLLSHMTIEANVEGYTVPIDVNQQAAEIEVRPDRTVITYSHVAFTVRQIMFSPGNTAEGTGPLVLYEFDCLHPTDFTFRFTPELRWMWPERNEGVPNAEWVHAPGGTSGFYVLHSDYPDLAGALTIPGAEPGILAPYQERPQVHPVELKLHIDPARDRGKLFPLLMAVGTTQAAANTAALAKSLEGLNRNISGSYHQLEEKWKFELANEFVSISTPDKALDEAFQWAIVSIEQLKTNVPLAFHPPGDAGPRETALVAGYYASADSARPGFGWFFGRDALYSLYAVNGYGDFALARNELDFLTSRQRADGKIMHEYAQTAAFIDWQSFPYMYAAADSTPLYLLAMEDYLRATGDTAFVTNHRDAIEKAWAFETDPAHDTDHDGIYDNSQGTGWVESWPGGMPHQEIYLALLDQQASAAMAELEKFFGDTAKSASAQQRANSISKTIETEYYDPDKSCYAFSHNADGSQDRTSTVYPTLAWWSELPNGKPVLAHPEGCLQQLTAHTLATDWGLRDVSTDEKIYDGMSYHQGSVWPLFTGWAALAEYRANQPLAGYQMLMENANLTWAQDLGADTELLSGDFFVPFGRSTSHQLWSSAMVITPTLRGLFGISIDAQTKTITVNPHLPATWDHAEIKNLRVGQDSIDLAFNRVNGEILVTGMGAGKTLAKSEIKIRNASPRARSLPGNGIAIPSSPVEVDSTFTAPEPGARSESARFLHEEYGEKKLTLTVEGQAGSDMKFALVLHSSKITLHADGAELSPPEPHSNATADFGPQQVTVHFPPGEGWKIIFITLAW